MAHVFKGLKFRSPVATRSRTQAESGCPGYLSEELITPSESSSPKDSDLESDQEDTPVPSPGAGFSLSNSEMASSPPLDSSDSQGMTTQSPPRSSAPTHDTQSSDSLRGALSYGDSSLDKFDLGQNSVDKARKARLDDKRAYHPHGTPYTDEEQSNKEAMEGMAQAFGEAIIQANGFDRYQKEIGVCDGTDPSKMLQWLRKVGDTPYPITSAKQLSAGPLREFLRDTTIQDWDILRPMLSEQFVSSGFSLQQQDQLRKLEQRPNETLMAFNWEFKKTFEEAYPGNSRPNHAEIVRLYLSALADRKMAEKIYRNPPESLHSAMENAKNFASASEKLIQRKEPLTKKGKMNPLGEQLMQSKVQE